MQNMESINDFLHSPSQSLSSFKSQTLLGEKFLTLTQVRDKNQGVGIFPKVL